MSKATDRVIETDRQIEDKQRRIRRGDRQTNPLKQIHTNEHTDEDEKDQKQTNRHTHTKKITFCTYCEVLEEPGSKDVGGDLRENAPLLLVFLGGVVILLCAFP